MGEKRSTVDQDVYTIFTDSAVSMVNETNIITFCQRFLFSLPIFFTSRHLSGERDGTRQHDKRPYPGYPCGNRTGRCMGRINPLFVRWHAPPACVAQTARTRQWSRQWHRGVRIHPDDRFVGAVTFSRLHHPAREARFCHRAKPVPRPVTPARTLEIVPLREVNPRERSGPRPCIGAHAHPSPGKLHACFVQHDRDKRGDRNSAADIFAPAPRPGIAEKILYAEEAAHSSS